MLEKKLARPILIGLLKILFRIEVRGLEFYHQAGDRQIIIANHQSFLDPLLLAVILPDKPSFVMNVHQARKWYFRQLEKIVRMYKVDPAQPMSMKRLIGDVRKGAKVVIFPEGRITTTGGIMKIYDGAGVIAQKTGAAILPVHIGGAEYSKLSLLGHRLKKRPFPKITIDFFPPCFAKEDESISARAVYDIMTATRFASSNYRRPFLSALLEASAWHGGAHVITSDISRDTMSYRQLLTRAFILSDKLKRQLGDSSYVGVLLPNAMGTVATFVALHMLARIPCMLNFSSGEATVLHACRIATVETILTSRSFVEKGKFESLVAALVHDIAYNSCVFQYWYYISDVKQTAEINADEMQGTISAKRTRIYTDIKTLNEMLPPASRRKSAAAITPEQVSEQAKKRIFKELDDMPSNAYRREHNVGKLTDLKSRCDNVAQLFYIDPNGKIASDIVPDAASDQTAGKTPAHGAQSGAGAKNTARPGSKP
jgi:1-acyl-sn-glycerol-3-phosphate acyltransferase